MNLITDNKLTQSLDWFTERYQYKEGARLLMRCLLGLAILKILIQTSEPWLLEKWQDKALQVSLKVKLLLFPVELVALNPYLFVIAAVALWLLGVIVKPRYWINLLSFLFLASWFVVRYPMINGSDIVLLIFSFWMMGFQLVENVENPKAEIFQIGLFNLVTLVLQAQVALIYLLSGWDKLMSEEWRSGQAFFYIAHFDTMFNPLLEGLFTNEKGNWMWSWLTIGFEMAFVILVWFRRTRLFVLCAGFIFHLIIWWMLALPDFALVMIATYSIFLRDSDFVRLRRLFKPQLP